MKNKLFREAATKATALAIGSLVIFSGQALAFPSNNEEVGNTGVLGNSELLIAKCLSTECSSELVKPHQRIALAQAISIAFTTVGNAWSEALASSIPAGDKIAISQSLAQAVSILGNANARAQSISLTQGETAAIAESIALAKTFVGDAKAKAESIAIGGESLAISIASAQTTVGRAEAVAISVAG